MKLVVLQAQRLLKKVRLPETHTCLNNVMLSQCGDLKLGSFGVVESAIIDSN